MRWLRSAVILFGVLFWGVVFASGPGGMGEDDSDGQNCLPFGLVITELMPTPPVGVNAQYGQWFEVYNSSDTPVCLDGTTILINGQEVHKFKESGGEGSQIVIQPGQFFVIGASKGMAVNGGIPVDYAYGPDVVLPPSGTLSLVYKGQLIDSVKYGIDAGVSAPPGVSLNLEPNAMDSVQNDDPVHWCQSTNKIETSEFDAKGTPGAAGNFCDSDKDGFSEAEGDCDDSSPQIFPGAAEVCNGVDDNCNGQIDEEPFSDKPVCAPQQGVCKGVEAECVDGQWVCNFPPEYEEGEESSCDGLDNDCDGLTDEGMPENCQTCTQPKDEVCNGLDDDCDGQTDEEVVPPAAGVCSVPQVGVCLEATPVCDNGEWKCALPITYEQDETLCDSLDNDCDGETDEGFHVGKTCYAGTGACQVEGVYVCSADHTGVVCNATPGEPQQELCGDGIDNDCDGQTDEGFDVGSACVVGQGACAVVGKLICSPDGTTTVCDATAGEPQTEVCGNMIDDDCDGTTDEPDCTTESKVSGCSFNPENELGLSAGLLVLLAVSLIVAFTRLLGGKTNNERESSCRNEWRC